MEKQFLIASSYSIGSIIGTVIFLFPSVMFIYLLFRQQSFDLEKVHIYGYIFVFFIIVVFFFIFSYCIKKFFSIKVDYNNRLINVQHILINIFPKRMQFNEIKSLIFFEHQMLPTEGTATWVIEMVITGIDKNILFRENVSRVVNYDLLEELCNDDFEVDYIVGEDKYDIGIL